MKTNYWKAGSWNVICDGCGFKFKSYQLKDRWDGLKTCRKCWESRHPIDFFKAPKESQKIPWTRPQHADDFIDVSYIEVHDPGLGFGSGSGTIGTNTPTEETPFEVSWNLLSTDGDPSWNESEE